ncbi:MAG: beta-phosphoglucomutase family hydrolase [Acidobacteriota bacterium]|nr:beta-phosphoglucomutase family hydrolase [Acidobacteriota bacterium]
MSNFTNRAFIFDMDGTIVDNMRFHGEAWVRFFAEIGHETDPNEFLIRTAGMTNHEIFRQMFGDGASDEQIEKYATRKEELYRNSFRLNLAAVAGLIEFLEKAKKLGVKMAVATSAPPENIEFVLDGLDLRKYFDAITGANDISNGKPDPEIFLKSAEKLAVEPQNCIVFEDAFKGFEAAHAAKMKSVAITTVNKSGELKNLPSVVEVIDDFTNLEPSELIEKHLPLSLEAK